MITRIFRVKVPQGLQQAFEADFSTLSIDVVESQSGMMSVFVGRPTRWAPDEYVMISTWENEQAIRDFAGERWDQAVIPAEMKKYVADCWVHHYEIFA